MPTNKNALTRFKIIDELLSNHHHCYSWDDITEEVNRRLIEINPDDSVTRRQIEYDIKYLEYESPFADLEIERYSVPEINIKTQKTYSKRCLRYKDPSYSIFKQALSSEQKYLLQESLSLLGQFEGLPEFAELDKFQKSLLKNEKYQQCVSFAKNSLNNEVHNTIFEELFTAITQKQVVKLTYHTFNELDEAKQVVIHPYLLKEYNRRWYVYGCVEPDMKLLNFALDRIDELTPLGANVFNEYEGNLQDIFDDIIGVTFYEEEPIRHIEFWVSDNSKNYVATKPLHDSQTPITREKEKNLREKYPLLPNGAFFFIECRYNYELIRELCSFGKDLIVLPSKDGDKRIQEEVKKE